MKHFLLIFVCFIFCCDAAEFDRIRGEINTYLVKNELHIKGETYKDLSPVLTKENLIKLLKEAINDDERLTVMLKDSQTHPLGFHKIMLMNDWGNNNWELRLHIWWPLKKTGHYKFSELLEPRHIHLFSFASRIITGHMEDYRYTVSDQKSEDNELFQRFSHQIEKLSKSERISVYRTLDAQLINNNRGTELISLMDEQDRVTLLTEDQLRKLLNMSQKEIDQVRNCYMRIIPIFFDDKGKTDSMNTYFHLKPEPVLKYSKGDFYFFPVEAAHSLYVNPKELTSTFFLAGKYTDGRSSGVYSRTPLENEDGNLPKNERLSFDKETLKKELIKYLNTIEKDHVVSR